MMLRCKCGEIKSTQPWNSAVTKDWICDRCRSKLRDVRVVRTTITRTIGFMTKRRVPYR